MGNEHAASDSYSSSSDASSGFHPNYPLKFYNNIPFSSQSSLLNLQLGTQGMRDQPVRTDPQVISSSSAASESGGASALSLATSSGTQAHFPPMEYSSAHHNHPMLRQVNPGQEIGLSRGYQHNLPAQTHYQVYHSVNSEGQANLNNGDQLNPPAQTQMLLISDVDRRINLTNGDELNLPTRDPRRFLPSKQDQEANFNAGNQLNPPIQGHQMLSLINPEGEIDLNNRNQLNPPTHQHNGMLLLLNSERQIDFNNGNQLTLSPPSHFPLGSQPMGMSSHGNGIASPSNQLPERDLAGHSYNYQIPTSTSFLPEIPSTNQRFQLPSIQNFISETPSGNRSNGTPFGMEQWSNWGPQNQMNNMLEPSHPFGPQGVQPQGLAGQAKAPQNFNSSGGMQLHFQNLNSPTTQNGNVTAQVQRTDQGQGHPAAPINSPNIRQKKINLVYDPRYESMGLPIDPHLRILAGKFGKGYEHQDRARF